ncbi:integrase [Gossypium australe]|uniref:Integrase n=1 Tax=Gossypium australe TaxID=47621 RepID=A0A5B6VWU5_9ROSI|nr:integrase [Gossypium australe]
MTICTSLGQYQDVLRSERLILVADKGNLRDEHQVPSSQLYHLEIPKLKWDMITMAFISRLPLIVDRLTKSTQFLPENSSYSLQKLVELYITEIVQLHKIPFSIVFDRDPRFTSRFWNQL